MIELETDLQGMAAAEATMQQLRLLGSRITGATFNGLPRKDGSGLTNADVATDLANRKPSWDFFSGGKQVKDIAQAYADEAIRRIQVKMTGTGGVGPVDATEIDAGAFLKAMTKWAEIVIQRIKEQKNASGGKPAPVNPGYAAARQALRGISTEIVGIDTGDMLSNISAGPEMVKLKAR